MGTSVDDLPDMRKPYNGVHEKFDVKDLVSQEPFGNFRHWMEEACNCKNIYEPNAMAVATATSDGKPSVRMILLKGFDNTGFKFYTNFNSRKGRELNENPNASLLFFWEPLKKMVRVEGTVEKLSDEESTEYFHSRPRPSQISACVSNQSSVVSGLQDLEAKRTELEQLYADESIPIPKPDYWGGYLLRPVSMEFWQGQSDRMHDRIVFRRPAPDEAIDPSITKQGDDGWVYERLYP